jgi:methyltransferase-like protein 6
MEASNAPRVPSTSDEQKLETQSVLNDFKQSKLETDARKNWDKFYMRNEDGFFKDRNWGERELRTFDLDLDQVCSLDNHERRVCRSSCGSSKRVAASATPSSPCWPISRTGWPSLVTSRLGRSRCWKRERPRKSESCRRPSSISPSLHRRSPQSRHVLPVPDIPSLFQLCTLIFVLSSVHPSKHADVIRHLAHVLLPDASLIVRDYGLFDHAMIRFAHKLHERFYARQDGTRAYFFDLGVHLPSLQLLLFSALRRIAIAVRERGVRDDQMRVPPRENNESPERTVGRSRLYSRAFP